jgi:hypothetical protein
MQQAARSDGGLLGVDADGTLVYSPRTWMAGRADQETVFELSDNYCVEGITTVWDATQTTTDDDLVNTIAAANIADVAVTATNAATIDRYGLMPWPSSRTDDLWADAGQGQTLVDWIVATRGQHYLRVDEASIYAHDTRRNLWPIVLDLRLGDRVDWYHEQPAVDGPALFAVAVIVSTITHEITPAEWVTTFATSRAVGVKPAGRWDVTTLTWDDTDPLNVWL